jgi:predicted acetyltransferase
MTRHDNLTLRPVTNAEFADWTRAAELPFFDDALSDERIERFRSVVELPRTLAAFDGRRIVGTSALLSMSISVPGGSAAMAGLTAVGVAPTHRRRGVLTALMRSHFDDLVDGPESLSGLYAAEAPIYERFGYGAATTSHHWSIDRAHSAFRDDVPTEQGVTFVDVDEALHDFPAIYEAVRGVRPGIPRRSPAAWKLHYATDFDEDRHGLSRRYLARLGDRGYVAYRADSTFEQNLPKGRVRVIEHVAVDPVASATLWRFVFDLDLVATIELPQRPPDDLLTLFLADPRRLTGWRSDALWLRLTQVGPALSSRTYSADDTIVFSIHDRQMAANTGRWRLTVDHGRAQCEPAPFTDPDLTVDIAHLGAAFLGNERFHRLLRAGRVQQHTEGAAVRADRMFFTEPAGWCPQEF